MYLPYKDDKHERAAMTRSEACSDNFRHPKLKNTSSVTPVDLPLSPKLGEGLPDRIFISSI